MANREIDVQKEIDEILSQKDDVQLLSNDNTVYSVLLSGLIDINGDVLIGGTKKSSFDAAESALEAHNYTFAYACYQDAASRESDKQAQALAKLGMFHHIYTDNDLFTLNPKKALKYYEESEKQGYSQAKLYKRMLLASYPEFKKESTAAGSLGSSAAASSTG